MNNYFSPYGAYVGDEPITCCHNRGSAVCKSCVFGSSSGYCEHPKVTNSSSSRIQLNSIERKNFFQPYGAYSGDEPITCCHNRGSAVCKSCVFGSSSGYCEHPKVTKRSISSIDFSNVEKQNFFQPYGAYSGDEPITCCYNRDSTICEKCVFSRYGSCICMLK